jgi:colanic acid/amylovoran biosynthesis protein
MLIEIRPGPLSNKGGELMLLAALGELSTAHEVAVEHWVADYQVRARLGLYQKVWFRSLGPMAGAPGMLLPRRLKRVYGLVSERDIRAVVDASGFAFSDQFGERKSVIMAASARRWRRHGKRLVLLPQAFGPFTGAGIRHAVRSLVENADLVFARDATSLAHLEGLGLGGPKIRLAPDFTIAMGSEPSGVAGDGPAYVVPNEKMITHTAGSERSAYMTFLAAAVHGLQQRGVPTAILVHESGADRALAVELNRSLERQVPVVVEEDALRLRSLIADARMLVGSRYHALVSALSNGVPVLAAGWSHKYEALLDDFGCHEYLVSPTIGRDELLRMLDRLTDESEAASLRRTLIERGQVLRARTGEMWAAVHDVLSVGRAAGLP